MPNPRILQGKKAQYNSLILRSLVSGQKTTKQIAEYICQNAEEKQTDSLDTLLKTYSVIARRGSRLDELLDKHYISRGENKEWKLTMKGLCFSLTLFDDLREITKDINYRQFGLDGDKIVKAFRKNAVISLLMSRDNENLVKKITDDMVNDPAFWDRFLSEVRDFTNDYLKKGVDIDSMTDDEFSLLVLNRLVLWFLEGKFPSFMKGVE